MRHQDWPIRLARYVRARRATPFKFGRNDCVTFAADWIVEATGADPVADLRGWKSAADAARKLNEMNGMHEAVISILGEPMSAFLAQRGDVVMLDVDGRESLGVCVGEHVAAPGENGVLLAPMADARCAWRIA